MHKIEVKNIGQGGSGSYCDVYVDGVEMKGVVSIDIHASVDLAPRVVITLIPRLLDVDGEMMVGIIKEEIEEPEAVPKDEE